MIDTISTEGASRAKRAAVLQESVNAANGLNLTTIDFKAEVQQIAPILAGGTTVTTKSVDVKADPGAQVETGSPIIDDPSSDDAQIQDLERLMAYLTLDSDERQAEEAKKRLETLLQKLDKSHSDTLSRIQKSIDLAVELQRKQEKTRIIGWITTVLSSIAAIAATVLTMGAATPLAVAAVSFTVAGTVLNLANQILTETGVVEKFAEWRADQLQKDHPELSRSEALAKANNEWNIVATVLQGICAIGALACGITQMASSAQRAATKAALEAAKESGKFAARAGVQLAAKITTYATQISSMGLGVTNLVMSFQSLALQRDQAEKEADVLECKKLIENIEAIIEEEEERLKELILQLQESTECVAEIVGTGLDNAKMILEKFNAIA